MTKAVFGTELKNKLLDGIKLLNASVSSTLGPGGRNVLIQEADGSIKATKDGVTVAKSFSRLEDEIENIGAQLVKQVSVKSANEAGDGTTTSTLLATIMVEEGMKLIEKGMNVVDVRKEMEAAVSQLISALKEEAVPVTSNEQLRFVATISGNNDDEIGNLITEAIDSVGYDGIVSIEMSKTGETVLDIVEGMQFERGYKSPYFVTDNNTMQSVLENPYILLVDAMVNTAQEMVNILTKANAENRPLLIVANDFGEEALATLLINKARGVVKVCAVKSPDYGDRRTLILEDLAVLTGATVISSTKGLKLEKVNPTAVLGQARTVNVSKDSTTIVDGKGTAEALEARAEEIKTQIDNSQTMFEKEKLQERLGRLSGGVAIISVGGNSEIEMKEKKDRIEDALYATKAAIAEGVIPGGGWPLYKLSLNLSDSVGGNIVKKAAQSPFAKINENAGSSLSEVDIASKVVNSEYSTEVATWDAKAQTAVDAFVAGLLDPVKVTRVALENALSVASTILTTESVLFEERKEDDNSNPMMGMGMM